MSIESVNIIGSGNVATHIAIALDNSKKGLVKHIVSSKKGNAELLASKVGAKVVLELSGLPFADLTIIAVKDDAIEDVVASLDSGHIVVHTSGSKPVDLLNKFVSHGILYPLQTFSKSRNVEMRRVPFFIDVEETGFKSDLTAFCDRYLSSVIHYADSKKRAVMHLAAVLSSNFTNQLLVEAKRVLNKEDLPLSILQPLLEETIQKAFDLGPIAAQTGPAKRKDKYVLSRQVDALEGKDLKAIYTLLSKRIQEQ